MLALTRAEARLPVPSPSLCRVPRKPAPLNWSLLDALALRLASTSAEAAPVRSELAAAARALAGTIAQRHPGHHIELRVPPFAAVQLGIDDAGAHKRGTPPNVVELDAATLIRLATGSLSWEEARAQHLVSASGLRSDLSILFPLRRTGSADPVPGAL